MKLKNEPVHLQGEVTPLLSILITTFNRAAYLEQLLEKLNAEWVDRRWPIEVIVADNASTDNTPSIVQRFVAGGLPLNYVQRPENVGFSRNLCLAIKTASGKYIWPLCDDDIPGDGMLNILLDKLLQDETIAVYLLNRDVYDVSLARCLRANILGTLEDFTLSPQVAIARFGSEFLMASGLVLRRDAAVEGTRRAEYTGCWCETIVLACEALTHGPCKILGSVAIKYREGNSGAWNIWWPVISLYYIPYVIGASELSKRDATIVSSFIANRDNHLSGGLCYVASSKSLAVCSSVNRQLLKKWYSSETGARFWFWYAFSLPPIFPRMYTMLISSVTFARAHLTAGGNAFELPNLIFMKYKRFSKKEAQWT